MEFYVSIGGSNSGAGTAADPFGSIQYAANLAHPGDVVHVAPGTYNERLITKVDGVHYVSDVPGAAHIQPTSGGVGQGVWLNSGNAVTIEGFEIDGSKAPNIRMGLWLQGEGDKVIGNTVHDIAIQGANDDSGGAAILMDGARFGHGNQSVIDNVVSNAGGANADGRVHGIYAQNSGTISGNEVSGTPSGICLWHDAKDLTITNNNVHDNGAGINIGAGEGYQSAHPVASGVVVTNNYVHDNSGKGIMSNNEAGGVDPGTVFSNNLVQNNAQDWALQGGQVHSENGPVVGIAEAPSSGGGVTDGSTTSPADTQVSGSGESTVASGQADLPAAATPAGVAATGSLPASGDAALPSSTPVSTEPGVQTAGGSATGTVEPSLPSTAGAEGPAGPAVSSHTGHGHSWSVQDLFDDAGTVTAGLNGESLRHLGDGGQSWSRLQELFHDHQALCALGHGGSSQAETESGDAAGFPGGFGAGDLRDAIMRLSYSKAADDSDHHGSNDLHPHHHW